MKKMDAKYVKANVSPDTNRVVNIVAIEQKKFVYEVLDEIVKKEYPDYFNRLGC